MAIAFVDPLSAARQARREKLAAELSSPDPVTRYRAREKAFNEAFSEMGKALIAEAKANAKSYQQAVEDGEKYIIN